ncbi:MAG: ribosome recycling factor [Alphaproteobacteria bacterium]
MAEQYSVQAENLMKSAVEEYKEVIKEVKATDANLTVIRNLRINIQGKPRRLVDVADLKKTDDVHKLQLLVFNTDHIELLTEQLDENGFSYEVDGQFINITVPDPSYKQLMEVVDDLNRKKNSAMGRLTKAKSEATTRARTAVENEFISQGVASAASKKCDEYYENYGGQIAEMTMDKIKNILGPVHFEKYEKEELDFS